MRMIRISWADRHKFHTRNELAAMRALVAAANCEAAARALLAAEMAKRQIENSPRREAPKQPRSRRPR